MGLLGRLALRKNELRLLRVGDFDLTKGTFVVHGKGGKVVVIPIAFDDLKDDLHLEFLTREPGEYLLHPKWTPKRPLDPSSLHLHFKTWLERAGLPTTVMIHELRHSAAESLARNRESAPSAAAPPSRVSCDYAGIPASEP